MYPDLMQALETSLGMHREHIAGKRVLEVGAYNVNGSARSIVEPLGPSEYIGTDMRHGPGVDEVCNIHELESRYGREAFDVAVCTETLEHVEDWRSGVVNIDNVLKVSGLLVFSSPSPGFWYHAYPHDYWRFTLEDATRIFDNYDPVALASFTMPGILFIGTKHKPRAHDLHDINLYRVDPVRDKRKKAKHLL